MPNIKSAKKRVLVAERNHARNVAAKSAVRTSVKKARLAVANKAENADAAVKAASIQRALCIKIPLPAGSPDLQKR